MSSSFSMGGSTHSIPFSLHQHNRLRLCERLRIQKINYEATWIVVEGGKQLTRNWTDHEPLFRQESYFQYLFGAREPDCFGAIDVSTGKSILFIPRLPESYAVWMGEINPPQHFASRYLVDQVSFTDEIAAVLKAKGATRLLLLKGLNTDSKEVHQPARFDGIQDFEVDDAILHPVLNESRVFKSKEELEVLRYVNKVSSDAHVEVMRRARPGMMEYQIESVFLNFAYEHGGCRYVSYACICGTGHHGATLHYGHGAAPNDGKVQDGDMVLLDMGAEYHCYASDITCSYPANGKFTEKQKGIYNAVLRAQLAVMKAMKPGVHWVDMHRLAEKVIAEDLLALGLLQGPVEEIIKAHIPALFMPHGLGHLMGLDTHDVGGYPAGTSRIDEPGIRSLRCGRVLEASMVLTVEPGIYFIDYLLDAALKNSEQSKYLNEEVLKGYRGFGGVRLEDDVVVTETGIENLTKCPRTVEEIEAVMAGGSWPKNL